MWRGECEGVRRRGLEERMMMEVERNSLRARVSALEKVCLFSWCMVERKVLKYYLYTILLSILFVCVCVFV